MASLLLRMTALGLVLAGLLGCGRSSSHMATSSAAENVASVPVATAPSTVVPALSAREINRQDRVPRARQRAEHEVQDSRPLLSVLPAHRRGVRFSIRGLSTNARKTLVTVELRGRTRSEGRVAWRKLLVRVGDSGAAYDLVFVR